MLGENLADVVEAFIQKILFVMMRHPLRQDRAAAADDAGDALRNHRQILNEHAGMDGHVIHALLRLLFDHFEHHVLVEIFNPLDPRDGFVNRHGPDGHGRVAQDRLANFMDVAAGRQVHHGVGAEVHRGVQLLEFFVNVRGHGRVADVGIDLAQRGHADAHGFEFGMIDVGGNDHPPAGDFIANQFRRKLFAVGDIGHLICDFSLARVAHLGEIAVGIARICGWRSTLPGVWEHCVRCCRWWRSLCLVVLLSSGTDYTPRWKGMIWRGRKFITAKDARENWGTHFFASFAVFFANFAVSSLLRPSHNIFPA